MSFYSAITPGFVLSLLVVGFPLGASPQSEPKALATTSEARQREQLLQKLQGATYRAEKGTVRLKGGTFKPAADGNLSGRIDLETDSTVFAREPDTAPIGAAVILNVNEGGTATWTQLHAVRFENGVPRDLGYIDLGDRVGIKRMTIHGDEITTTKAVFGPNDPACCPSLESTSTYRLSGSTLVRKLSDKDVESRFQTYLEALSLRIARIQILSTEPNPTKAFRDDRVKLQKLDEAEQQALAEVRKAGLLSDPRFLAMAQDQIDAYNRVLNRTDLHTPESRNAVAIARAVRDKLRAILALVRR